MSSEQKIRSKRRYGFTLVELLVVISIIAVLLSILMPSLSKARGAAQRVVCQNNLKQQSLACSLYMEDNRGVFPGVLSEAGHSYWAWGGKEGTARTTNVKVRYLNPYIGRKKAVDKKSNDSNLKLFSCPSDKGALTWEKFWWMASYGPLAKTMWDAAGTSYIYNSNGMGFEYYDINNRGSGLWMKKQAEVKRPTMCILAGDISYLTYAMVPQLNDVFWHNNKELGWANVAFVDGHVNYLKMTSDKPNFQNGAGWTVLYDGPK